MHAIQGKLTIKPGVACLGASIRRRARAPTQKALCEAVVPASSHTTQCEAAAPAPMRTKLCEAAASMPETEHAAQATKSARASGHVKRAAKDEKLNGLRDCAELAVSALKRAFDDEAQLFRHAYTDKATGATMETLLALANIKQFRDAVSALKELTEVVRDLYDLPNAQEAEAKRIANEKLKLDERKLCVGDARDVAETGVILLPDERLDDAPAQEAL